MVLALGRASRRPAPVREVWPIGGGTATLLGASRRTSAPFGSGGGRGSPLGSCRSRTWMAHSRGLSPASVQAWTIAASPNMGAGSIKRTPIGWPAAASAASISRSAPKPSPAKSARCGRSSSASASMWGMMATAGPPGSKSTSPARAWAANRSRSSRCSAQGRISYRRPPAWKVASWSTVDQASSMADSSAPDASRAPEASALAARTSDHPDRRCRRWAAHGSVGRRRRQSHDARRA